MAHGLAITDCKGVYIYARKAALLISAMPRLLAYQTPNGQSLNSMASLAKVMSAGIERSPNYP